MSEFNEKTTVPVFAVIMVIPLFVGLISWITFIAYTSNSSAAQIVELKTNEREATKEISIQLSEINSRLSRIETKLEQGK